MTEHATLERRLANFRSALGRETTPLDGGAEPTPRSNPRDLAEQMAEGLGGEVVRESLGTYVRVESRSLPLPVDRDRLAGLPGQPPRDVPLICLDTETTGLGTAAGTYAFLVGLGWWQEDRFRTVQLLLPEQPHERALLAAVARHIPSGGWLVSYNGRGFDWPLLETRYRMARRPAPAHAGHLDLLPLVRRLFRHRMPDARLRTVEEELLGVERHEDVEGWEIPGRYLDFLRTGHPAPLVAVTRHNAEDVRSLARLLGLIEALFGDAKARRGAPAGDVAGLARLFLRERRLEAALDCLEAALAGRPPPPEPRGTPEPVDAWWLPARRADFGGAPGRDRPGATFRLTTPWTEERLLGERAHVLRRLGRLEDAAETWANLATGTSRLAAVAAVELAKLREHRLGDASGALEAVRLGRSIVERRRALGRPELAIELDLVRRGRRLRTRLSRTNEPTPDPRDTLASGECSNRASISTAAPYS
ncbi:MAG TPA: ribonuclease H-like domain-containing protein [Vitreimonas sp.]|nr:ribonuclease H-like domain-containing protein [Vitreimonas sp.]